MLSSRKSYGASPAGIPATTPNTTPAGIQLMQRVRASGN